jgi:hypothetical protein
MSSRLRIRVPAKKPRSWGVTLIQSRGKLLGYVEASEQKAAELEAAKALEPVPNEVQPSSNSLGRWLTVSRQQERWPNERLIEI